MGLSRNTVRKVVRSQATSFEYERSVQPLPRLGAWTATLDGMLMENALKPTRERLTVIGLFEALQDLGYEGGYDAVRRYAKRWRGRRVSGTVDAYVPLIFAPGEAYQFDWSHEIVVLNGTTTMVKAAHLRLYLADDVRARLSAREPGDGVRRVTVASPFSAAPARGIYDNMKTAVDAVFAGKERQFQPALSPDVRPLAGRTDRLHAGGRLGEGAGREAGRSGARATSSRRVCSSRATRR